MLRLLAYAVLGFVAYELYQGFRQSSENRVGVGGSEDDFHARTGLTGPGRGELLTSEDNTGAASPHYVGRGVVQA